MATSDGSCAVCLSVAKDPRQVPCGNGHVFCLSCLEGLIAHGKNVDTKSFPCPCCRNRVNIPRRGVAAFPPVNEVGSSDPAQRPDRQRSKLSSSPRQRLSNGRLGPRFGPPGYAQVPLPTPFDFMGPEGLMGSPRRPFLPHPGPPRRMHGLPFPPFAFPFGFDMKVPEPKRNGEEVAQPPSVPPPGATFIPPFAPPLRRFSKPSRSLSADDGPVISSTPRSPSRQDPRRDDLAQASKGPSEKSAEGAQGLPEETVRSSEDLDMEEVLLVIAQMEEEQQLVAASREREQDEMLKMQIQINEEEDMLEATY